VKAMTSTGRRLDEQRTVENFGNRKVLKDATNRIMMISYKFHNHRLDGFFVILLDDYIQS
jgi:patatin-like phospholipase/acyl hydrolase